MTYPIKTLDQLPLFIKAFRQERGLTQHAVAEQLGISQQAYARFEGKPHLATLERLFLVLRILGVEISLEWVNENARNAGAPEAANIKDGW